MSKFASLLLSRFPENRVDAQFVHYRDQTANVVAENLGEHFILHRRVSLAAYPVARLRFEHREGTFDV